MSGRFSAPSGVRSTGHRSPGSVALKITRTNFVATYIARNRLRPSARYRGRKISASEPRRSASRTLAYLLSTPIPPNPKTDDYRRGRQCEGGDEQGGNLGQAAEEARAVPDLRERFEASEVRRSHADPRPLDGAEDERHPHLRPLLDRHGLRVDRCLRQGPHKVRPDGFREPGLPRQRHVVRILLEDDVGHRGLEAVQDLDPHTEDVRPRVVVRHDDVDVVETVFRTNTESAELRSDIDDRDPGAVAPGRSGACTEQDEE